MKDYKIAIGGVMRCCLDRHQNHENPNQRWPEDPQEGDLLECPHGCKSRLVFHKGVFEWYRPDHPLREPGRTP